MKKSHKNLLKQLSETVAKCKFGGDIQASQAAYDRLHSVEAILLKTILDFVEETEKHTPEIAEIRNLACQLLIVAYREASRKDLPAAEAFFNSFTDDYPGVAESSILPRLVSLTNASLAMREVADTENRLLIWQQVSKQFQATSEFLCGLFPYLIIMWRVANGKSYNSSVFTQSFGQLVNQFSDLTGGEDGPFYLFIRIAHPKIRNAIAHETAWIDSNSGKVRYIDGRDNRQEYEIDLVKFTAIASIGSHIVPAYLAALAVIGIMKFGSCVAKALIPPKLVNIFTYRGSRLAIN